ncbi:MAG: hypothetical protein QG641_2638 [Candidatus Poribacteria bacterium]|nr:hypothetical protein [Candidatus Poribacteria bacterium]
MEDEKTEPTEQETDQQNTEDSEEELIEEDSEGLITGELVPKRGCLKGCLMPIIIFFVVMLALGVGIHAKRNTIREWFILKIISNTQENVMTNLPKEIDKKAIEDTFDKVKTAFKNGKIDEQTMKQAINDYLEAVKGLPSAELKKSEIEKLMTELNNAIITPEKNLRY